MFTTRLFFTAAFLGLFASTSTTAMQRSKSTQALIVFDTNTSPASHTAKRTTPLGKPLGKGPANQEVISVGLFKDITHTLAKVTGIAKEDIPKCQTLVVPEHVRLEVEECLPRLLPTERRRLPLILGNEQYARMRYFITSREGTATKHPAKPIPKINTRSVETTKTRPWHVALWHEVLQVAGVNNDYLEGKFS